MDRLDQIKASNAWDAEEKLPSFPGSGNPWLCMAWADRLSRAGGGRGISRLRVEIRYIDCEVKAGLFNRRPDGSGGRTSWDEILGAAYFSPWVARRIRRYLDLHLGFWDNTDEPGTRWQYRMPFLRPYLSAAANDLWAPEALLWGLWLITQIKSNLEPLNAGGRLRNWLMSERMSRHWAARPAIAKWRRAMTDAGLTLEQAFGIEPREYPVMRELAANIAWES